MALRKRTDRYWERRANERLLQSEKLTKKYMAELAKVYSEARRQTVKQLQDIYAAYYKRDKGFDMEALDSIVPTNEIKKLIADMKKRGINTTLPENYAGRVKRLELINEQLRYEAQKVALQQQGIDDSALRANFEESYYRAGYDVSRGIGSTPVGFSRLDTQTINQVMSERFMGENYSDRIWTNTDLLASRLQKTLAVAIANGQGIQKTARDIRNDYNVNQYYAERLVRTESNHFHNQGELEAYQQMGFEYFQFLATLDNRTSEICQEMDGKKFKVSEGIPGDNVPPLHPNCRSTIVPYFKGYEPETRLYRNPETGKNSYTYSATYTEWRQKLPKPRSVEPTRPKVPGKLLNPKISKEFKAQEKEFVNNFTAMGNNIRWIPKDVPKNGEPPKPTNDFIWNKLEWELKTSSSLKYKTVAGYIRDGVKQGKQNFMIDVYAKKNIKKFKQQIAAYNARNPQNKAKRISLFTKDGIVDIVKPDKK